MARHPLNQLSSGGQITPADHTTQLAGNGDNIQAPRQPA